MSLGDKEAKHFTNEKGFLIICYLFSCCLFACLQSLGTVILVKCYFRTTVPHQIHCFLLKKWWDKMEFCLKRLSCHKVVAKLWGTQRTRGPQVPFFLDCESILLCLFVMFQPILHLPIWGQQKVLRCCSHTISAPTPAPAFADGTKLSGLGFYCFENNPFKLLYAEEMELCCFSLKEKKREKEDASALQV